MAVAYGELTQMFERGQVLTNPVELITYEIDAGFDRGKPDGVFFPNHTEDVSRLMRWAADNGATVIARGAGTGLAGGVVPEHGGLVVVTSRLNRILSIDDAARLAHVQSGVTNLAVDTAVKRHGLYFPPDPSSGRSSVIGGNIGTNAGGPHCFKYGVTTNYVQGVRMVLADGTIVRLGGPAVDYPEYDLLAAVVGSEGTLGTVTEAWLRLIANPPAVKTMMVSFDTEAQAGEAVSAAIASGLVPATLELMDQRSMRMIEEFTGAGLPVDAGAALIVEVDGYPESIDTQIEEVADSLQAHGGRDFRIAQSEEERAQIWYGRKSAAGAFSRISPSYYLTDVTVRRSLLGPVLTDILAVCDKYDVRTANFFHAGDGNLHPLILCDESDAELMERVHKAGKEIIQICLDNDGSITGEHGVGMEKRGYMAAMYSGAELAAMVAIKTLFDPGNRCNPGKVLPPELPPADRVPPSASVADVVAPTSAGETAAVLAACTRDGRTVRIGHASDGDRAGADLWLSTRELGGIHTFAPEDLYVTAGAGVTVDELQAFVGAHGMQVPVASPWGDTSLGGLIARGLNAPLRMRYGALRDVMLCATVAMADGRVIRAGRPLVKNVAGYDLPKLFVGAQGTLGVLTDVTLKLTPDPRARRAIAAPVATLADGVRLAKVVAPHALVASSLVIADVAAHAGMAAPYALLYTAEGLADDVDAELTAAARLLRRAGAPVVVESGTTGVDAWRDFLGHADASTLTLRVGVPVAALEQLLQQNLPRESARLLDYASGHLYMRVPVADRVEAARRISVWRSAAAGLDGYALVLENQAARQLGIDAWGARPSSHGLMQGLKDGWDPAHVLNPHAFSVH
jgi:D-lactate dehydrogenase (cytochrome)